MNFCIIIGLNKMYTDENNTILLRTSIIFGKIWIFRINRRIGFVFLKVNKNKVPGWKRVKIITKLFNLVTLATSSVLVFY